MLEGQGFLVNSISVRAAVHETIGCDTVDNSDEAVKACLAERALV